MKDEIYKTIANGGSGRITRDRSRFIGTAAGVESCDAAQGLVEDCSAKHPDARHVCSAFRVRQTGKLVERFDDAGEPGRTGGFPILQLLQGRQLQNVVVAVVRYYGGKELGTGGLSRAYRDAARLALERAACETIYPRSEFVLDLDYDEYHKVEQLLANSKVADIGEAAFGKTVSIPISVRQTKLDKITNQIRAVLSRDPWAN